VLVTVLECKTNRTAETVFRVPRRNKNTLKLYLGHFERGGL
jgi:hypothetical protein